MMHDDTMLRVMSYNIRYDNENDPFTWAERRDAIYGMIAELQPAVIGMQEVLANQLEDLQTGLEGYESFGVGRGPDLNQTPDASYSDDAGEHNPVFYDAEKLELLEQGTFWLSETPEVAGSQFSRAPLPRIVTWGKFQERATGQHFVFLNTHFAYQQNSDGQASRAYSVRLILNKLPEIAGDLPAILTGDFNLITLELTDYARSYLPLRDVLNDTFFSAAERNGPAYTFTGFSMEDHYEFRLDYIMVSPDIAVESHHVRNDNNGEFFLSDHLPVLADVHLPQAMEAEMNETMLETSFSPDMMTEATIATDSLVLHLNFDDVDNIAQDSSTQDNHGTFTGRATVVEGAQGAAIQFKDAASYITLPRSESLETVAADNVFSMMLWLKPMDEEGYSDFLSKGDWNVLKLQNPETLNFFAGGWRRGELQINVPENWNANWHHVAAVAHADELMIYVDGILVDSLFVEDAVGEIDFPWSINRNAQEPEGRNFKGAIDDVRLYSTALSDDDIMAIYENTKPE